MLRRALWVVTTPLALTFLLAAPARSSESHEEGESHAGPIDNFASFSYSGKDSHGGAYEPGDHKMPPPFLAALANFAVLAFLVGKYAAPGVAKLVKQRHDGIAEQLAESAKLRQEAQQKLDEYTRKLSTLQDEIDRVVTELRAESENETRRILAEAEARADRMRRDAEAQIQAEIQRVRITLERETVLAAVELAEKLLREKTTGTDQRQLADRFVTHLTSLSAGRPS